MRFKDFNPIEFDPLHSNAPRHSHSGPPIFEKLWRARSPLYRSRFLRPRCHFSAFFEIYKINRLSHRLHFKIFRFSQNFVIFADFFQKIRKIDWNRSFFGENFMEFCRNFAKLQTIAGSHYLLRYFLEIRKKICNILHNFQEKMAGWLAVCRMTPPPRRVIKKLLNSPGCATTSTRTSRRLFSCDSTRRTR